MLGCGSFRNAQATRFRAVRAELWQISGKHGKTLFSQIAVQFLLTSASRFANRYIQEEKRRFSRKNAVNAMVVGTGETSRIVRRQLEEDAESGVKVSCIFTYKDAESGSLLDGIPVVANLDQFTTHLEKYQIKRVILADSLMPMSVREQIRGYCQDAGIDVQDFSGFLRYDNSGLPFMETQLCTGRSSLKTVTYAQNKHQISHENRANCPLMAA